MMIRVLFTGGSGLVGRNIIPILQKKYIILYPIRKELNLLDENEVLNYVKKNKIDIIIHSANPNPTKNSLDKEVKMFEDSLRIFMNIYRIRKYVKKVYFIGSGAELDKTLDICKISENDFDRSVPKDVYGFAKYIMTNLALQSDNVYNLRLFACYGPTDHESKFISHCIRCVLRNQDITIRQNCYFDYIHTDDLANIISFFIEHEPKYHDYNIASGSRYSLIEIAQKVLKVMKSDKKIVVLSDGLNKEYTPSINRLLEEMGNNYQFKSLEEGIKTIIPYEEEVLEHEKKSS